MSTPTEYFSNLTAIKMPMKALFPDFLRKIYAKTKRFFHKHIFISVSFDRKNVKISNIKSNVANIVWLKQCIFQNDEGPK